MRKIRNYLGRNLRKKRGKDILAKKERSVLMAKIRSHGTKFEKEFIAALREQTSKKFLTNAAAIRGKPDIVFKKQKVVIFLDSDFWHGWQYPRWKHLLKNNFWREKIENNRRRDKRTTIYLCHSGWRVLRFWEHEIKKNPGKAVNKITKFLK